MHYNIHIIVQITILLAITLLPYFIGYATAVIKMDPKFFACTTETPISEDEYAIGNPPVGLSHIFCGKIKQSQPKGFHSRPGDSDPPSAIAENQIATLGPIDCFSDVKIYNDRVKAWKPKKKSNDASLKFCFFPTSWSVEKTVDVVRAIYHHCQRHLVAPGTGQICGINYKREGFDVLMYVVQDKQDKELVVNTAWPQPTGGYPPCAPQQQCDISHL